MGEGSWRSGKGKYVTVKCELGLGCESGVRVCDQVICSSSVTHLCVYIPSCARAGEDDCTIVENLSQKLDPSSPDHPDQDGGEEEEEEGGDPVSRLGALRKKFLAVLLDHVYLIEVAGGMRAICFMQVIATRFKLGLSDCLGYASSSEMVMAATTTMMLSCHKIGNDFRSMLGMCNVHHSSMVSCLLAI